jgi:hypothetical protein
MPGRRSCRARTATTPIDATSLAFSRAERPWHGRPSDSSENEGAGDEGDGGDQPVLGLQIPDEIHLGLLPGAFSVLSI